ncbi:MAG: nicotinate-nicotinamide nucleotide adenylyltransferase [Leptolyngbya sp. PLA1]|nr:nicotinate-nicotinamide nucleotide adenylyltransferase [Leptolyngbya sp. PLA1]
MSRPHQSPPGPITPWPLPEHVRSVILVGGTFDPVHTGHVLAAVRARAATLPASGLLFVPAAVSPFKVPGGAVAGHHRAAMLSLALTETPQAAVWTDELDRARPGEASYTIDSVRRAARVAPAGSTFRLLIGADQALRLHEWREARALAALAPPLILMRGQVRSGAALSTALRAASFWTDAEIVNLAGALVDVGDDLPQSSTEIRAAVARGGPGAVRDGWLHPGVATYIESHGLYKASGCG